MVWVFLRLIWAEWSSRVTGSLSAILVLVGLGNQRSGGFWCENSGRFRHPIWYLAAGRSVRLSGSVFGMG